MPNPSGRNQHGPKNYPPSHVLSAALRQYSRERNGSGLTTDEQLARLQHEFGLHIGCTKLYALKLKHSITTVWKNTTSQRQREEAVLDLKADDVGGKWGVDQTRQRLADKGVLIKRDELRTVLHAHFEDEFDGRFIGPRQRIPRVPLQSMGPWYQVHCDGHEKLNAQALQMGTVALPIYGFKDQFSSFLLALRVLPNVRNVRTVCHFFLDVVDEYKCVPLQLTTDKGTEIGEMLNAQASLRMHAAPEFTEDAWPSSVQVQSKRNTPIEGFWCWMRNGEGHNIKEVILMGKARGLFNPNDPLHVNLFNFLFPPLVQTRLDEYREYWNNHRISPQKKKALPSGSSPRHVWTVPNSVNPNARNCAIRIDPAYHQQLRDGVGGLAARRACFSFVDAEFQVAADAALGAMGFPAITLANVWDIFDTLLIHLHTTDDAV